MDLLGPLCQGLAATEAFLVAQLVDFYKDRRDLCIRFQDRWVHDGKEVLEGISSMYEIQVSLKIKGQSIHHSIGKGARYRLSLELDPDTFQIKVIPGQRLTHLTRELDRLNAVQDTCGARTILVDHFLTQETRFRYLCLRQDLPLYDELQKPSLIAQVGILHVQRS